MNRSTHSQQVEVATEHTCSAPEDLFHITGVSKVMEWLYGQFQDPQFNIGAGLYPVDGESAVLTRNLDHNFSGHARNGDSPVSNLACIRDESERLGEILKKVLQSDSEFLNTTIGETFEFDYQPLTVENMIQSTCEGTRKATIKQLSMQSDETGIIADPSRFVGCPAEEMIA